MKLVSAKENEPVSLFSFPPQLPPKPAGQAAGFGVSFKALPEGPMRPLTNFQNTMNGPATDDFATPNPIKKLDLSTSDCGALGTATPSTEVINHANDIVMWKQPLASAKALGIVFACFTLYWYMVTNDHSSIFLWLGRLMLAEVAINFTKSMVSIKWQQKSKWEGGLLILTVMDEVKRAIELLARLHDKYLCASDPNVTLKVAMCLWGLCMIATWASTSTIVVALLLATFALPPLYMRYGAMVLEVVRVVKGRIAASYTSLGLSRRLLMSALAISIGFVATRTTWENMALSVFVGLVAIRCQLQPNEVHAIKSAAQPYAQSVQKASSALTTAANGYIARMTPMALKRRPQFN